MLGLNKVTFFIIVSMMVVGSLTATYYSWKGSIEKQALLEFNQKQIEQNLKDQKDFLAKQKVLNEQQEHVTRKLLEKNNELNAQAANINKYLNSQEARQSNRPSSDILKKTIEQLQEQRR